MTRFIAEYLPGRPRKLLILLIFSAIILGACSITGDTADEDSPSVEAQDHHGYRLTPPFDVAELRFNVFTPNSGIFTVSPIHLYAQEPNVYIHDISFAKQINTRLVNSYFIDAGALDVAEVHETPNSGTFNKSLRDLDWLGYKSVTQLPSREGASLRMPEAELEVIGISFELELIESGKDGVAHGMEIAYSMMGSDKIHKSIFDISVSYCNQDGLLQASDVQAHEACRQALTAAELPSYANGDTAD